METRHSDISRDTKINSIGVREDLQICIQSQTEEKAKIANVNIRPGSH